MNELDWEFILVYQNYSPYAVIHLDISIISVQHPCWKSLKPSYSWTLYCWFHGSSSKAFLLFFLLPDWLKLNHLKSRMECGFSDIFSRHICSTVAETIGVINYAASFGAKKCSENHIWSSEMILGPWNQRLNCMPLTLLSHNFHTFQRFHHIIYIWQSHHLPPKVSSHCSRTYSPLHISHDATPWRLSLKYPSDTSITCLFHSRSYWHQCLPVPQNGLHPKVISDITII